MRPRTLMLSGVTRSNRHAVMAEINDAVAALGGWIIGHTLLSNIATTFRLALPGDCLKDFEERVAASGIRLDGESNSVIAEAATKTPSADHELTLALNVTFIHDEPDLRREVPAVPG